MIKVFKLVDEDKTEFNAAYIIVGDPIAFKEKKRICDDENCTFYEFYYECIFMNHEIPMSILIFFDNEFEDINCSGGYEFVFVSSCVEDCIKFVKDEMTT